MDIFFEQLYQHEVQKSKNIEDDDHNTRVIGSNSSARRDRHDAASKEDSFSQSEMTARFARYEQLEKSLVDKMTRRYRVLHHLFQVAAIWLSDTEDTPYVNIHEYFSALHNGGGR